MKALIAHKLGMASTINEKGSAVAVTLLSVEPNVVTQVKTIDNDGYTALQVGTGSTKKLAKPQLNHFKKSKVMPKVVCEFITDKEESLSVGDEIKADVFSVGDNIDVTSTSKGKGFAGTIKRHNFHRQRKTHGGKGNTRKPGSIGSMYPQKIFKGKKMAGQMGASQVTTKNLKVAVIDLDMGIMAVTGAVPGPKKSVVLVRGVEK